MPRQKYEQIYSILKGQIEAGDYPVGGLLPSENVLIGEFQCSRNTVRRALANLVRDGYVRVRVDGEVYLLSDDIPLDKNKKHTIDVVIDRLVIKDSILTRLTDSLETAAKLAGGIGGAAAGVGVLVGDGNHQVIAADLREKRVHAIGALKPLWIVVEIGLGERTIQGRADKARIHRRVMLARLQRLLLIEVPLDLSRIIATLKALPLTLRLRFRVHLLIDRSNAAREVLLELRAAGIVGPVIAAGEHATGAVKEDTSQRPSPLRSGLSRRPRLS